MIRRRIEIFAPFVRISTVLLLLLSMTVLMSNHATAADRVFQAGAFAMDITPTKLPVLVNGGMYSRTADQVVDRLHARCLVLDDGGVQVAIVVVDSCMVPRALLDEAKEMASQATGIATERMLISSTHTHSAPSVHGCLGTDADEPYSAELPALIAKGIQLAHKNLQPARVGWAVGKDPNNVFCRRWLMKDGTAATNPFSGTKNDRAQMNPGHANANKIRRLGPVDDDVSVLAVQTLDGRPLAVLGNYSTHYAGAPALSADYFAVFADRIGKLIGAGEGAGPAFVGIMSNGTSGDANCYDFTRDARRTFDRFTVADDVAQAAYEAYRSIKFYDWVPLVMDQALLTLGVRMPADDEVARAKAFLETPEGKALRSIPAVYAREAVVLSEMPPTRELKLQALRIGGLGITAIPNEVYGITGLTIKKESPLRPTFNISLANGCEGYIPPPEQHDLGGYTTWRARTSCLEREAEPKIRATIMELLGKVAAARKDETLLPSELPEVNSPIDAEQSLRWLYPRPGMRVELVASEPLIHDPVAFDWGPDGRLWVAEMLDYPSGIGGKGKPGGRVVYLQDTDADGRYDKSTVFVDGIAFPNGVMAWRDGVLVTAAPEIFYAEDTDGDGKADQRHVLFRGFFEGNQQLRVNGLRWGLDNWIYCASGSHHAGYGQNRIKSTKTGQVIDLGSHDFRMRPDDGQLDPTTGPAQFGRNRDAWGNWFGVQNANPMWHYVLDDRYLRRNPNFVPPDPTVRVSDVPGQRAIFPRSRPGKFYHASQAGRFTSANSAIIYRDKLLGQEFAGNSFVSEPVHNLIHREIVSPRGVTFTSRRADDGQDREFLASADTWFRPTMLRDGPDGALWIADMYREIIEHPRWVTDDLKPIVDTRNGHDRGRIYRVFPSNKQPRPIPRLDQLDTAELVTLLESPSGSLRDMVQRQIVSRRLDDAVPLLAKLATDSQWPETRMQALCTLDGLGKLDPALIARALADVHPGVRRQAIRLCEGRFAQIDGLPKQFASLSHDSDAAVRLQLAYTLGEWSDAAAATLLGELIGRDRHDPFIVAAAFSSLNKANVAEALSGLEKFAASVSDGDQWQASDGRVIGRLLAMVAALQERAVFVEYASALAQTASSPSMTYAFAELLDDLQRQQKSAAEWLKDVANGLGKYFAAARSAVQSADATDEVRLAAITLLGRNPEPADEDLKLLASLLVPQSPPAVQSAALESLVRTGRPEVAALALAGWKGHGPMLRNELLDALTSRGPWTEALFAAMQQGVVRSSDISASYRANLLKSKNAALQKLAQQVFATSINANRQKVVEQYAAALTARGDAARGAEHFKKHCAKCHQLAGEGTLAGPDLAALTDKSPANLLASVLDPNRAVEPRYLAYTAETADGRIFSGMLLNESGGSITLLAADGKRHELLRSELVELESTGVSLMPDGLEKDLTPQDLADIFSVIAKPARDAR